MGKYIEILIRIPKETYENLDKKEISKMWNTDDNIVKIEVKCQILALGVDGFISGRLEEEEKQ